MRDCKSERKGLLMHNKARPSTRSRQKRSSLANAPWGFQILFARPRQTCSSIVVDSPPAWAYVGSANLSESAWGKLVKERSTKAPKLTCRNWECGVIVPVRKASTQPENTVPGTGCGMSVFGGQVPVPMLYPGEVYGTHKPWYFQEQ